jgi:hypothetical protein
LNRQGAKNTKEDKNQASTKAASKTGEPFSILLYSSHLGFLGALAVFTLRLPSFQEFD